MGKTEIYMTSDDCLAILHKYGFSNSNEVLQHCRLLGIAVKQVYNAPQN
jgi:hypothetical protein